MPDHLELQLSCLAGGAILQVHSLAEAEAAETWGAVAVYFSDLGVLSDADLIELVENVSLHPLCTQEDFSRLNETYKQRSAHHFARIPITDSGGDWLRAVADVRNFDDVRRAFRSSIDRSHLVICEDVRLLPESLRERRKANAGTLVFAEIDSLKSGVAALQHGAHGVLLTRTKGHRMPTVEEQKLLMRAIMAAPSEAWPLGKRVIGVMSHQGDYPAHIAAFEAAIKSRGEKGAVAVMEIRTKAQYNLCDAIVLPGGWSNLQTLFLAETGLDSALRGANEARMPVLGTCAGMILSGSVGGDYTDGRAMLGLIPGTIDNNVVDGMTAVKRAGRAEEEEILFSNGPVLKALGDGVRVLAQTCESNQVVGARHGSTFVFSYHDYENTHPEFLDHCLMQWRGEIR